MVDDNFTSPVSMPDHPFQGALRIRGTKMHIPNTDTLAEMTGPPTDKTEIYPEAFINNLLTL